MQTLKHVDIRDNFISEGGRVAMAAVVMPAAPSVVAALLETRRAEEGNDSFVVHLPGVVWSCIACSLWLRGRWR